MKRLLLFGIAIIFNTLAFSQVPIYLFGNLDNAPGYPVEMEATIFSTPPVTTTFFSESDGNILTFGLDLPTDWYYLVVEFTDCNDSLVSHYVYNDTLQPLVDVYLDLDFCSPAVIYGCTDPEAFNYNPAATENDGSCIYVSENDFCQDATPLTPGTILIDNSMAFNNENVWGDCWSFGAGEGEQSSIWYSFTTPDEPATIHIEAFGDGTNTLTDTQFGLFESCNGEMIHCDGNSGNGLFSAFTFGCGELEENTTYILIVDGYFGDAGTCYLTYSVSSDCEEIIPGCMDPQALNYNPEATVSDGSCEYPPVPCEENAVTLSFGGNIEAEGYWYLYNNGMGVGFGPIGSDFPEMNLCLEDGCYELVIGLMDTISGSNILYSVIYENEELINGVVTAPGASVFFGVNADCENPPVYGCMDPDALNYNPLATMDDGSCEYACNELWLTFDYQTLMDDSTMFYWEITNDEGTAVESGYSGLYGSGNGICLEDGCYTLSITGMPEEWIGYYGIGSNLGVLYFGDLIGSEGPFTLDFGVNTEGCEEEEVYGCMDPDALNYDPAATIDDGSCEYAFDCEISFEIIPDSTGESVIWIVPSANISNAVEVYWDFGDGTGSSELYPQHQYEDGGTYTLCLHVLFVDGNGSCETEFCAEINGNMVGSGFTASSFSINVIENASSGVEENFLSNFTLYPNPTNDQLTITYSLEAGENLNFSILDVAGKTIFSENHFTVSGENISQFHVGEFNPGLYLLRITGKNGSTTSRFVISK